MGNSGLLWEVAEDVVSSSEIEEFNQVSDRWDSSQLPLSSNANGGVLILKMKERGGESPHAKLSRWTGKTGLLGCSPAFLGSDCVTWVSPAVVPRHFAHLSVLLHGKSRLITKH